MVMKNMTDDVKPDYSHNFDLTSFDDVIEYTMDMIGSNFEQALMLANAIIDDPASYTGPQAAMAAIKMATYRLKIGQAAQYWKIKSAKTKKLQDRLVKDSLMTAYDGILEIINTLKITARHDHELVKNQ